MNPCLRPSATRSARPSDSWGRFLLSGHMRVITPARSPRVKDHFSDTDHMPGVAGHQRRGEQERLGVLPNSWRSQGYAQTATSQTARLCARSPLPTSTGSILDIDERRAAMELEPPSADRKEQDRETECRANRARRRENTQVVAMERDIPMANLQGFTSHHPDGGTPSRERRTQERVSCPLRSRVAARAG